MGKNQIVEVHAEVLSESAYEILDKHKIKTTYSILVDKIINRDKTDICPMERAVMDIEDSHKAYEILRLKYNELMGEEIV